MCVCVCVCVCVGGWVGGWVGVGGCGWVGGCVRVGVGVMSSSSVYLPSFEKPSAIQQRAIIPCIEGG